MESRDGVSQRAWWRAMLHKHRAVFQNSANGAVPVQRMLGLLQEAQGREDEIFARHFTERED
jgi:hypothetical protein